MSGFGKLTSHTAVISACALITELVFDWLLPEELQAYKAADLAAPFRVRDVVVLVFGVPILGTMVVAWIGIWRFWKHAPALYLASCVGGILLLPFTGSTVLSPLGTAIDGTAGLISGMIIGLLYFSALRDRFGHPQSTAVENGAA